MLKKYSVFYISSTVFLILILDARTVLAGAKDGISLCLQTVIPSLFPFFILSNIITGNISGAPLRILSPIGRLCRIPKGSEIFLLLGFLGGYPVGAKSVSDAYRDKKLSQQDAERMLGFCNNPGPAFIFGMVATLFHTYSIAWILWAINITSALFTAILLPGKSNSEYRTDNHNQIKITEALNKSVQIIANVCAWVIVFRIIIAICKRYFLYLLPTQGQVTMIGILELSNGCFFLSSISTEAERFLLCCIFLTFGGFCVTMQTASQLNGLRLGIYLRTKALQTIISALLALILQPVLFETTTPKVIYLILPACLFIGVIWLQKNRRKKEWKLESKCSTI